MPNRKKRLEKGIESLDKEIEMHEDRLKTAEEKGDLDLAGYYKKEIETLEMNKEKKKRILEK